MKSYKAQTNSLLLAASMTLMLALTPVSAFADDKDDLYSKGTAFVNNGKAVEARDAFCMLAKKDNEFKDAQKQCDYLKGEAQKVINLHNKRYGDAEKMIDDGKYDDAEKMLKLIKYGDWADAAQKELVRVGKLRQDKINADAQNKNAADQEKAANAKFEQGKTAWENGNFALARAALGDLTGSHADEAKDILNRISRYEDFMQRAQTFAKDKNFTAAATIYNQAGAISPNGPGNPFGKAQEMATQATSSTTTASNPTPPQAVTNKNALASANRDKIEKVDESKLVQDAKQLIARKKYPQARNLLDKVLAQNVRNAAALDLMKSLPQPTTKASTPASPSDEDPVLAAGISKFYETNYDDAEAQLSFYVSQVGPKKPGLGNFYLGVTLLTRFYLTGEADQSLRLKAIRRFSAAKDVAGFKAPEKLVSPKILAVYNQAKGPVTSATP